MKKRSFHVLRGKPTPFMNAPIAVKRSYLTGRWPALKKFVKAFADATRFMIDNRQGTRGPLAQLLNNRDPEIVDFPHRYLHANSEASLYPPDDAVQNLLRMSVHIDKKLGAIGPNRILDLPILDELGTRRDQRTK